MEKEYWLTLQSPFHSWRHGCNLGDNNLITKKWKKLSSSVKVQNIFKLVSRLTARAWISQPVGHAAFSCPGATLLLVCTKISDLGLGPIFWTGAENSFYILSQSDLSDLTLSMSKVTGSPWIADFLCWTFPEIAILGADQRKRGLWGREWPCCSKRLKKFLKCRKIIHLGRNNSPPFWLQPVEKKKMRINPINLKL